MNDFNRLNITSPEVVISKENSERWDFLERKYNNWTPVVLPKEKSIPHIIHQIWLGSPLPEKYDDFIKSFTRLHPAWEYKLWTEKEILNLDNFAGKEVFKESRTWGAKSDIARYAILHNYGGFYFDTDFECIQPLDFLADRASFIASIQTSSSPEFGNAMLASCAGHPIIKKLAENVTAIKTTEMMDNINGTGPGYLTKMIFSNKDTLTKNDILLPSAYFFPVPNYEADKLHTAEKKNFLFPESYGIHYWEQSWFDNSFRAWFERKILRLLRKIGLKKKI